MAESVAMPPSPAIVSNRGHTVAVMPSVERNAVSTARSNDGNGESDDDRYFDECASSPSSNASSIQRNWSENNTNVSDDDQNKSDSLEDANKIFNDSNDLDDEMESETNDNGVLKRRRKSSENPSDFEAFCSGKRKEDNLANLARASSPGQFLYNALDYINSKSSVSMAESEQMRMDRCTEDYQPAAKRSKLDHLPMMAPTRFHVSGRKTSNDHSSSNDILSDDDSSVNAAIVGAVHKGLSQAFDALARDAALKTIRALEEIGLEIKKKLNSRNARNESKSDDADETLDLSTKNEVRRDKESGYDDKRKQQHSVPRNVSSSSFTIEGEAKELRTASQSQLCFGNVQVHPPYHSTIPQSSTSANSFTNSLANLKSLYGTNSAAMMAAFSPMILSRGDKRYPTAHGGSTAEARPRSGCRVPSSEHESTKSEVKSSPRSSPPTHTMTSKPNNNAQPPISPPFPRRPLKASRSTDNSPSHSPTGNNFFKPYQTDSPSTSLYNGFLSQFGSSTGKFLNSSVYHALASGLMDKSSGSLLPGAKQPINTSRNLPNIGARSSLMHPSAASRNHFPPNLPAVNPFFPPTAHNSPLAALYPGFQSSPLPLLQNQFSRQNSRHGMDYFDSLSALRLPQPSLRSGIGRDSRGSLGSSGDYRDAVDGSPYSMAKIHEGLTPQHLKKAKLLFFYTRYPSANTLRIFFPDVNFDRAITSQLIKWFSNFREFFYIQMEKFARQALTDGIRDPNHLKVTRDCELLRVLNLHYNKCNDFKVPTQFLKVTEASLREFFMAIKAGKDKDPAWKKVIYKVICKLDFDIPEIFKSPSVLDRLHEVRD